MRVWFVSGIGALGLAATIATGCRDEQVDVLVDVNRGNGGTSTGELPLGPGEDPGVDPGDPGEGTGGLKSSVDGLEGDGGEDATGGAQSTGGKGGSSSSGGKSGSGGSTGGSSQKGGSGGGGSGGGGSGGGGAGGGGAGGGGAGGGGNANGGTSGITNIAGSGCGDFVVTAPETCDPVLAPGCSSTCQKDACRQCEELESNCPAIAAADGKQFAFCEQMTGNASGGPKAGVPKAHLCLDLIRCARASKCAGTASPEACYCGDVEDLAECFAPTAVGTGPCVAEFQAAAETTAPADISARFLDETYAIAVASNLLKCDGELCVSECVPPP